MAKNRNTIEFLGKFIVKSQAGSMFIKDGKNIGEWNLKEQIKKTYEK